MSKRLAIVIPARYGSTRFEGKPLAMIAGKSMLNRVTDIAKHVAAQYTNMDVYVTTEDTRIADHAATLGVPCIMTNDTCKTGSDRVLAAIKQLDDQPDFVVNMQGDAPFTSPDTLHQIFKAFEANPTAQVITPVHRLSWDDLDRLRDNKKSTPFSGTTAIMTPDGRAVWFSKNIIPAIRKEAALRAESTLSPVYQHIGLYGFRCDVLAQFCTLPESHYEALEGLEQLRLLEHNIPIDTVNITIADGAIQSGIDSPEDITRAEAHIAQHGEILA